MTQPLGIWAALPDRRACFPQPTIFRNSARCCSMGRRFRSTVQPRNHPQIHHSGYAYQPANPARLGVGHRFSVFGKSGRVVPGRFVFRTHGFHRNVHLDRSVFADFYVILLANSGHPQLRKAITPLRRQIATIAAASVGYEPPASTQAGVTETGLDVLAASHFGIFTARRSD